MNHYFSSKSECFAVAQSTADQSARDTVHVKLLCIITLSFTFTSFWSRCVKPGEDRNIEEYRNILKHRAILIFSSIQSRSHSCRNLYLCAAIGDTAGSLLLYRKETTA